MIMPGKHITLSDSFIGLGSFILLLLTTPKKIDDCWIEFNNKYVKKGKVKKKHSFDNFILTVDLLYMMGAVDMNERGEIYNAFKEIERK